MRADESSPGLRCHLVAMSVHCTMKLWEPFEELVVEGYQGLEEAPQIEGYGERSGLL